MAGRTPIFSAKQNRYQIGYIEGEKAFDLFGRKRCNYCARSGNLRDTDSGTIVGYVSLQGKLIGASWVIDQLFSNSDGNHQEIRQREDQRDEPNRVLAREIYERPLTENTQAANGAAEPPGTPAYDNGEPAAKLLAIFEAACDEENPRLVDYRDSLDLVVADKRHEPNGAYELHSIGENSSSPSSAPDEFAGHLFSDSGGNPDHETLANDGPLHDPTYVGGAIYEQFDTKRFDTKDVDAASSISERPSSAFFDQDESADQLPSDSNADLQQPILLQEHRDLSPSAADIIYEQHDPKDTDPTPGGGEALSLPSLQQDEAATELLSNSAIDLLSDSDGDPQQPIVLHESWPHDPTRIIRDKIYEQNNRGGSSGASEAPSSPSFRQDEAAAELLSDSAGNPHRPIPLQHSWLHDLSRVVADESDEPNSVKDAYLAHGIGKMSGTWSSERSEAGAERFSNPDHDVDLEIIKEQNRVNRPSLLPDEIVERNEADDSDANGSARKISTRATPEQCEFATVPIVPGGQTAIDPTDAFFSVDLARSIGLVRRELWSESHVNGPGDVVSPGMHDPTKSFFSVNLERTVEIVRRELGNEGHQEHPGDESPEMPDLTSIFFAVDLERALEKVRKELDKEQR